MKLSKWLALFAFCATLSTATGCVVLGDSASTSSYITLSESVAVESEKASEKISVEEESSSMKESVSVEETSSQESSSPEESSSSEESFSSSEEEFWEEEDPPVLDDTYFLEPDNRYVTLDIENKISTKVGEMSFITKNSYRGIKRIAFNAKTGETVSWWGIAITDDTTTANVYNTDLTTGSGTGGYWTTFVYDFEGEGCTIYATRGETQPKVLTSLRNVPYSVDTAYSIYFVGPLWETFSELVCIDNFTIELVDGTTYMDTFDDGVGQGLFYADRAVSHVIDTTLEETLTEIPATVLQETDKVYYTSDEKIDFTAYAPVTVENWAGSGTSNPNLVTDEQYRYMAEAGFTKSLGLYEGRTGDSGYTSNQKVEKDSLAVLKVAEKYGIKYYALNEKFYNFVRPDINIEFFDLTQRNGGFYNRTGELVAPADAYKYLKSNWMDLYRAKMSAMFDGNTQYIDSPAYGGNFASDEPALPTKVDDGWDYGELEQLYYQILLYNEYMAANSLYGGEAYVNLNPYANVNEYNRAAYNAMLDYYFEKLAPLLGYVCYDQYPLNYSGSAYVNATHLLNLEIVANYCKQYGVEFRSFLWAKTKAGHGHRGISRANDLRFQAYANLAFGVREMPYYTYFNYYAPGADGCDSLIDCQTGERTKGYYWAKMVNNEIHSFEQAYLNFQWEGSTYYDVGMKSKQLSLLETSLSSHKRLVNIGGNTDVLVGVFTDEDGQNGATDGFIVMNYADPYYTLKGETDNVVLDFDKATHALVYKDGKQYVAKLDNGRLSMYLEAGEGIFVVPFNG